MKNRTFAFWTGLTALLIALFFLPPPAKAQIFPPITLPVSINAFVTGSQPVKIKVFTPAAFAAAQTFGGTPLFVAFTSTPTNGTAVVNADNTITYRPGANFPGVDSFQFTYYTDTGITLTGTVTVGRYPTAGHGNAAFLLSQIPIIPGPPATTFGFLQANVSSTGTFTAKLLWKGVSYPLAGRLSQGTFFRAIGKRDGTAGFLNVRLQIINPFVIPGFPPTGSTSLSALVVDGADSVTAITSFSQYDSAHPAPSMGQINYAVSGQPIPLSAGGWVHTQISPTGLARVMGQLPDGTPFSATSVLVTTNIGGIPAGDSLPVYAGLYATHPRGFVAGTLSFAVGGAPSLSSLNWTRPAEARPLVLAAPISNAALTLTGEVYTRSTTAPVLPFSPSATPNAKIVFSDGNLGSTINANLKITKTNAVSVIAPNPRAVLVVIDAATGLFRGTFSPVAGQKRAYAGAFLQTSNKGTGIFAGSDNSGGVTITPVP